MADKAALRTTSRKTRGRLDHQALSVVISREFVRLVRERFMGASIAGYCAIGTEMNPYDAMVECHAMGCKLCVPVIRKSEKKLVFGHWTPAMDMVIGQFGIAEPVVLDQQVPDVIVLPCWPMTERGDAWDMVEGIMTVLWRSCVLSGRSGPSVLQRVGRWLMPCLAICMISLLIWSSQILG